MAAVTLAATPVLIDGPSEESVLGSQLAVPTSDIALA
jgi:hypothetical protein